MAKIELTGFEEYEKLLRSLQRDVTKICKAVVYPGAGVLAEAVRAEVEALPAISDGAAMANWRDGLRQPYLSESQKAGLQASLGISNIRRESDGVVRASVGFEGYNGVKTRHFPHGQPNPEVARSLEKGTSYLDRDPFMSRAVREARDEAIAAMSAEADAQIARIMNENT